MLHSAISSLAVAVTAEVQFLQGLDPRSQHTGAAHTSGHSDRHLDESAFSGLQCRCAKLVTASLVQEAPE